MRYIFGEWQSADEKLTVRDAETIAAGAESARAAVARYPMDRVYALIGRVRDLWRDPAYAPRVEARSLLPAATGFSQEMVDLALGALDELLDPAELQKKVARELGGQGIEHRDAGGTVLRWQPLGTLLHVLSGNVFLVGASSLLEGMLTRNVNILKASSGERVFLPRFVESIRQVDVDGVISRAIAVVDYASNQRDVMAEFKRQVDGIVVWGGDEAVREYRNDLPARTRVIVFGPKISFGLVTRAGLAARGEADIAKAIAQEISIWDQNACTAPQACYVEGAAETDRLAARVAEALAEHARMLPAGPADVDTAVEIQKLRGVFEVTAARGEGNLFASRGNVDWTVVVDRDRALVPSPLHRTIRLIPYDQLDEVAAQLRPMRGYLQTAGLAVGADEIAPVTDLLLDCGADRLLDLGNMLGGHVDDPHDGAYDLPQLMRLTYSRLAMPRADVEPWELRPEADRKASVDSALRALIERARRAPFYAERLRGLRIESTDDLPALPMLARSEMESNMPPWGDGLSTEGTGSLTRGGYVSRSGGSSGEPKFSLYDAADWEGLVACGARIFGALGVRRGDRLANLMIAGDLYGSFVSFDHVNARLGVQGFAFADRVSPATFVDTWRRFRINVVQGVPPNLMPLFRAAKELDPSFSIETVIFAGTSLGKADAEWLQREAGVRRIASVVGANDGGPVAYQCDAMSGALHHLVDEYNYVEIVDDEGRRVEDGQPGRILITSLAKLAFPLIRYELGDRGRIVPGRCSCGRTTRRLEHLGRADDIFYVGMATLRYGAIAAALEAFRYSELQVVVRAESGGDYLVVRVEGDLADRTAEEIHAALLEKVPTLRSGAAYHFLRVEVEVCAPGGIPRNPRSGKVKAIVDER
ncbi:hypothetical protein LZC95_30115 [Pendulispora brunnea]|uniref:AMP-dependent synthetase/ligase domain-containing protein n=1 Tax=Pendulispora brunnea TaxID=2905690 RepID=A0ABZ2K2X4_9BACT